MTGIVEKMADTDGLLYQVTASAIGYATDRIKKAIYIGKAKYLQSIRAAECDWHLAEGQTPWVWRKKRSSRSKTVGFALG